MPQLERQARIFGRRRASRPLAAESSDARTLGKAIMMELGPRPADAAWPTCHLAAEVSVAVELLHRCLGLD